MPGVLGDAVRDAEPARPEPRMPARRVLQPRHAPAPAGRMLLIDAKPDRDQPGRDAQPSFESPPHPECAPAAPVTSTLRHFGYGAATASLLSRPPSHR